MIPKFQWHQLLCPQMECKSLCREQQSTAAMGQIQDVMMQMKEVELQDNPLFMELTEVQKEEEEVYLN